LDYAKYLQKGIDYGKYKQQMAEDLVSNPDEKIKGYIRLNPSRMQRVEKTFSVSSELAEEVKKLKHKTWWLLLTEHWCGDAAQTLPVLNKIAEISEGKIVMKLVYRDENVELMDRFLTSRTRSIPKLIQLDEDLNITGSWGPRPLEAQQLVKQLRSDPAQEGHYGHGLHLWYAKDKQHAIEIEILELLFMAK
jgi:thioredoxin-like negative regulator of GroEL